MNTNRVPAAMLAFAGIRATAVTDGCALGATPRQQQPAVTTQEDALDPAAEAYSITAPGARNPIITAEIYTTDDPTPGQCPSRIALYGLPEADADLDVAGADQLIAAMEQFIPRLRALRNHLAPALPDTMRSVISCHSEMRLVMVDAPLPDGQAATLDRHPNGWKVVTVDMTKGPDADTAAESEAGR